MAVNVAKTQNQLGVESARQTSTRRGAVVPKTSKVWFFIIYNQVLHLQILQVETAGKPFTHFLCRRFDISLQIWLLYVLKTTSKQHHADKNGGVLLTEAFA